MQSVAITTDKDNRLEFKNKLFSKIEAILAPPPSIVEPDPIKVEIVEKYSTWVPARLALELEDGLLPEPKKEDPFLLQSEEEKRASLEYRQLEMSKIPERIIEPKEVVIIDKYSNWTPARVSIQPEDNLLPEIKKQEQTISPREIEKRAEIKLNILSKVEKALVPKIDVVFEPEIEIIDKFSQGIPQRNLREEEAFYLENSRVIERVVLDTDIPKRLAFKDSLNKKLEALSVTPVVEEVIEIVSDYSQRSLPSYGLDFEESVKPLIVSDLQESIVDFCPVEQEPVIPVLRVPENYGELDERALYGVLIRNPVLRHSAETANLAIDVLSGRSNAKVEFIVVTEPVESVPVKKAFQIEKVTVLKADPVIKTPMVKPVVADPDISGIVLPNNWDYIPLSVLRVDLLNSGATPEQVDFKLAQLVSLKVKDSTVLEIDIPEEFQIDLPEEFSSWKPNSQYIYLTKERKLTPEKANEVIWKSHSQ